MRFSCSRSRARGSARRSRPRRSPPRSCGARCSRHACGSTQRFWRVARARPQPRFPLCSAACGGSRCRCAARPSRRGHAARAAVSCTTSTCISCSAACAAARHARARARQWCALSSSAASRRSLQRMGSLARCRSIHVVRRHATRSRACSAGAVPRACRYRARSPAGRFRSCSSRLSVPSPPTSALGAPRRQ